MIIEQTLEEILAKIQIDECSKCGRFRVLNLEFLCDDCIEIDKQEE